MTLLFMDGFQGGDIATKWSPGSGGARANSTPRFAGGAYWNGNAATLTKTIPASSEVFVACAEYWATLQTSAGWVSFYGDAGVTQHITVMRNASGLIEIRRGSVSGTIIATGTTVVGNSLWTHMQVRCVISDTVGVVEVKLNGQSGTEVSFSGDTKNGGTASTIDAVAFSNNNASFLTDVAILNTSGSVNNTWPGDVRVQTLVPNADGNTSQGVGSDGNSTQNFLLVDEQPFSSTDYVGVTTDGQGDTYGMSDLAAGTNTVKGVQVSLFAAKSDSGTKSIKRRIRSGGTTYAGSSVLLGTSYQTLTEILELDPATSAGWTVSNVNAVEVGFEAAA